MTVLSAMRDASVALIKRRPSVFFSSSDKFEMEMVTLVNQVAKYIAEAHDWQALTKIYTFEGDGVIAAFPKPDDYDRMVIKSQISDEVSWFRGYTHAPDLDTWIGLKNGNFVTINPGWWVLLNDQFQFDPPPSGSAMFPYISKNYARSQTGAAKPSFTSDEDTFVLCENLLTLGLIWRWRENNHLDATGDQANFEMAMSQKSARDGGSRVIRKGGSPSISIPWPRGW